MLFTDTDEISPYSWERGRNKSLSNIKKITMAYIQNSGRNHLEVPSERGEERLKSEGSDKYSYLLKDSYLTDDAEKILIDNITEANRIMMVEKPPFDYARLNTINPAFPHIWWYPYAKNSTVLNAMIYASMRNIPGVNPEEVKAWILGVGAKYRGDYKIMYTAPNAIIKIAWSAKEPVPVSQPRFKMRGGHWATDRRLGRIPSLNIGNTVSGSLRSFMGADQPIISKKWGRGDDADSRVWLDQGNDPACVGFAWALEQASEPYPVPGITNASGTTLYNLAKTLDSYPGVNYDGTSTEGGVLASVSQGKVGGWRWAESIEDIKIGIGYYGPVPIGISWYSHMDTPNPDTGLIDIGGSYRGGHELVINGYDAGTNLFRLANSWSKTWGKNGNCFIHLDDLDELIFNRGGDSIIILERFI